MKIKKKTIEREEQVLGKMNPSNFSWHQEKPSGLSCYNINKKNRAIPVEQFLSLREARWVLYNKERICKLIRGKTGKKEREEEGDENFCRKKSCREYFGGIFLQKQKYGKVACLVSFNAKKNPNKHFFYGHKVRTRGKKKRKNEEED